MTNKFTRGSEWRKWDLHIHTPASILNNNFGSDWDNYVKKLFKTVIEKDISVIGITDYFTINGYKKLKDEYLSNDTKLNSLFSSEEIEKIKKILVLPNIEFRSDVFVGSNSINFHVLFSETLPAKSIEENFLHEIYFRYDGDPDSSDKYRKLTEANLVELGARLKSEHAEFSTHADLYIGMMNAVVDDKSISQILYDKSSIFGDKYLFVTMADEDLSSISWNSRDHLTRKSLLQKSHLLFSSNPKTRQWGIGRPPYTEGEQKFIEEFKSLKACIHGSDAHEFKFIGNPCAKRSDPSHDCITNPEKCDLRFCWIKADTTFEGLRQVLYEPDDRVHIQTVTPSPLKSSQTIAEFDIKGSKIDSELEFKETSLFLNEGLVAITGGKGSGKTAIVDLIANTYEDRAHCDDKNSFVRRVIENEDSGDLETILKLQNRQEYLKEIKKTLFIEGASIVYVAQGELEKHVEDPSHLEAYINSLIFESKEIRDSELLFDYENISTEITDIGAEINVSNKNIFKLENETNSKTEDDLVKENKKYLTDLTDTKKKLTELAKGLSEEKIKESEQKQKQLTEFRDKKTQLTELGTTVKETLKFVDQDVDAFNRGIDSINALSTKLGFAQKFKNIEYTETEKLRAYIEILREEVRKTIGSIEKFQKELEEKEKGIKEHTKLLDKKKELEKSIEKIKTTLKLIEDKKKELVLKINERTKLYENLLDKRLAQRNKYLAIIQTFSSNKNDILSDLEFGVDLLFDKNRFIETMSELVDLRKIRIDDSEGDSDIQFFIDAMEELVTKPSSEKVKLISTNTVTDLLPKIVSNHKRAETISRLTIYESIFADYLNVMPSVKYKKVKLSKLSLGQKATVLIKIYLAQGENPIIIDSHDDHLDNEFIMEELVKALRQAKQYRQVIIVSNNGNVVVNSDAEQIILALRSDNGEISYSSGSLEDPELRSKLLQVLEGGKEAFSKRQKKYRI